MANETQKTTAEDRSLKPVSHFSIVATGLVFATRPMSKGASSVPITELAPLLDEHEDEREREANGQITNDDDDVTFDVQSFNVHLKAEKPAEPSTQYSKSAITLHHK